MLQLRAAEHGVGAMFLGRGGLREAALQLREIEVDFGDVTQALRLVCAKSAMQIPRIRAVADHLVLAMQAIQMRGDKRAGRLRAVAT